MKKAGHLFGDIQMSQFSAQCFYSAGDLGGAGEMFLKLGNFGQAAECFQRIGSLRKAANLYAKAGLFANSFECYEQLEDWDGLIQCLNLYKDKFQIDERQAYIEKYFPIALNSVYQLYANLDPEGA